MELGGFLPFLLLGTFLFFTALAAHPFVTYPLSLLIFGPGRSNRTTVAPLTDLPSVDICISVFNEADVIVRKIESTLRVAKRYGPARILVYSDGSFDDTNRLLEPFKNEIDLIVSHERLGKTHGMGVLIDRSGGDLIMFTDANVMMDDDALIKLAAPFADPQCGCATARLHYINRDESPTTLAGSAYWSIEEYVKGIESSAGFMIGVDGASFVVRRSLYHPAPKDLIDDLFVTLKVLIEGKRVVRASDVVVYERNSTIAAEEYGRKVRIACQAMRVHRTLWPQLRRLPLLLVYSYISHRWLKWMMPYSVLVSVISLAGLLALVASPMVAVAFVAMLIVVPTLGGLFNLPGASLVYTIMLSLFGVAKGVFQAFATNQTFTTWEPAASVRESSAPDAGV